MVDLVFGLPFYVYMIFWVIIWSIAGGLIVAPKLIPNFYWGNPRLADKVSNTGWEVGVFGSVLALGMIFGAAMHDQYQGEKAQVSAVVHKYRGVSIQDTGTLKNQQFRTVETSVWTVNHRHVACTVDNYDRHSPIVVCGGVELPRR